MDPLTALTVATTAFKTIKKCIELGKEINGVNNELGQWFGAVGAIRQQHAGKKGSNKTVEEESLDTYVALQKAKDMERELKSFMNANYGPTAWDDVVRIQNEIIKQRKLETIRRQDKINAIVEIVAIGLASVFVVGVLVAVGYFALQFCGHNHC